MKNLDLFLVFVLIFMFSMFFRYIGYKEGKKDGRAEVVLELSAGCQIATNGCIVGRIW
jgi:preprotein translocase subunit YajC